MTDMDEPERDRRRAPWSFGIGRGELILSGVAVLGVATVVLGIVLAVRLLMYLLSDVGPV